MTTILRQNNLTILCSVLKISQLKIKSQVLLKFLSPVLLLTPNNKNVLFKFSLGFVTVFPAAPVAF